ncbi:PrpF domain-containing protein [Puniceibacterium sp. IMCC21224]|uniref:PrpF domain-containing protein n=1 Tax=Puniceibacterium sp. IMCC21224 TaxID=1618204 RepID=UPI00065D7189|nr:PrpF domain-containing protein [Puniceibacterium sp. IMCC21224]KMK64659.1 hypothetical protein IMCC21224_13194 [Puniceibacterium sp. IMCC21224]
MLCNISPMPVIQGDGTIWFPVHHMRGGTSTGLIIQDAFAPAERHLREELLRHLMGVPQTGSQKDNRQITGLGRGYPTSNKVFFVSVEGSGEHMAATSTLAQLAADHAVVDWSVNCGNMSAAIPMWLTEQGWFPAQDEAAEIDIRNTNTGVVTTARMARSGSGAFVGAAIPGVDGVFPQVDLFLNDPVGSKTGTLLPTGRVVDIAAGRRVSCVDVAVPMVICDARDFGKTGYEAVSELDGDAAFKASLRETWVEAGLAMNLKRPNGQPMTREDLSRSETIPKICLVAPPRDGGTISVRYFTPQSGHATLSVSGGSCLAAACLIPGSVANSLSDSTPTLSGNWIDLQLSAENPAGKLDMTMTARIQGDAVEIHRAGYRRNAQVLLKGHVPLYRASSDLREALAANKIE